MANVNFLDLENDTMEDVARKLATVYKTVIVAQWPIYRWLQIVNDVTILAEEIRRGEKRKKNAIARALKVLIRLLEFIGFYLQASKPTDKKSKSSLMWFVAEFLQQSSYTKYFGEDGPKEGPTRWILAKYPGVCAKCADPICACILTPWYFEERREKPEFFLPYQQKVRDKRRDLAIAWKEKPLKYFTLPDLFGFFRNIYRNTYYNQDPWKIAMHLTEEVGEATIELSRLELVYLTRKNKSEIKYSLRSIRGKATRLIDNDIEGISKETRDDIRNKILHDDRMELDQTFRVIQSSNDDLSEIGALVSEKFKEELADVFSWLVAVMTHLNGGNLVGADLLLSYLKENGYVEDRHKGRAFKCPECGKDKCRDKCLVEHAFAAELHEKAARL